MKYIIKSARPKQWVKNLIVFAAPIFAFNFETSIINQTFIALICFCLISSGIYFLNDALDIEKDKLHPIKRYRPIASGKIKKKKAIFISFVLICLSILFGLFSSLKLFFILIGYLLIQFLYCTLLKNKPIIDIFCIASGFLFRAVSGGLNENLELSYWFILSVGLLSLFLAIEKRKAEVRYFLRSGNLTRNVLKSYSLPLLNRLENVVTTSSFLSYSLWASGPLLYGAKTSWMLITVPFVLYGIFRYQLLSDLGESANEALNMDSRIDTERPEEILFKDRTIQIVIFLWLLTCLIILGIS